VIHVVHVVSVVCGALFALCFFPHCLLLFRRPLWKSPHAVVVETVPNATKVGGLEDDFAEPSLHTWGGECLLLVVVVVFFCFV
jgi:hypothetical protein